MSEEPGERCTHAGRGAAVLEVTASEGGMRLGSFLARRLELSLSQVHRLLERGAVRLGGRVAWRSDKGRKLASGQRIEVEAFDRPGRERPIAEETMALDLVATGPGGAWLVVNKPAGVPVHPLEPQETGTLLNGLIARFPFMHGVGEGGLRSGVVHRLDVETSGAVAFATRQDQWQRLRDAFRAHRTKKEYRAIALGQVAASGEERLHLVVARHRPARVRVVDERAAAAASASAVRACHLSWRVCERFRGAALVEITLGTGFLHQIRVTMAHIGHPLAGDSVYGPGREHDPTGAARCMLHARRLVVDAIDAVAPEPPDFQTLLAALRGPGSAGGLRSPRADAGAHGGRQSPGGLRGVTEEE